MPFINLNKVGVEFPVFGAGKNLRISLASSLTGGLILPNSLKTKSFLVKALEDITFNLKKGDRLGLVGHNGAGKSTLLRVLAGVYQPTSGHIHIEGRITPLLNQTPGMEPEDTGYENIFTVGMYLGMSHDEVQSKALEIIEFSGLGEFIHMPIRSYSSGMQARLGFSICTALNPGIMLLDEGIGAADAQFADKAAKRITELMEETEILVLASHSDSMIQSMCNKAALIEHGRLIEFGSVDSVYKKYYQI